MYATVPRFSGIVQNRTNLANDDSSGPPTSTSGLPLALCIAAAHESQSGTFSPWGTGPDRSPVTA
jgi:hypothetical protein